MFAVKDKLTNKYLRNFSRSFNEFRDKVRWKITKENEGKNIAAADILKELIHNNLFSLDTPDGAKLYKTRLAVTMAFYSFRLHNVATGRKLTLSESLPWLEIVEVRVVKAW